MMNRHNRWFQGLIGLGLLLILAIGLVVLLRRLPAQVQTGQATATPVAVAQVLIQDSPLPTPLPTETAEPPTPTMPPMPTPVPTPVVTAIPTIKPPYLENLPDQPLQPFWLYYWHGNEIWRVDNQGQDNELLLDTDKAFDKWLTPPPVAGSDCCWSGQRVIVSPDGRKLALVLGNKNEADGILVPFTLRLYIYDTQLRSGKLISEGVQPIWAPNGQYLAFSHNRGLWIANLDTGEVQERVGPNEDKPTSIVEFAWSPDSTRLAFMNRQGSYQLLPVIWVVDVNSKNPSVELFNSKSIYPIEGITWLPDGQSILYRSSDGSSDFYPEHIARNLWLVSLATGATTPLTHDMVVQSYGILDYYPWLFLAATYHLHEFTHQAISIGDLWMLNLENNELRRLTANQGNFGVTDISADGSHLIGPLVDNPSQLLSFSLIDGSVDMIKVDVGSDYALGGAK